MKTDDIESKKETNQYYVYVFPEARLEIQGTSKDKVFFSFLKR